MLDELQREGLLSEARYCEMVVQSRVRQGYGPIKIRYELHGQGVARELIEATLAWVETDWGELAASVGDKRFGPGPDPDMKTRAKRQKYLRNRGFEPGDID